MGVKACGFKDMRKFSWIGSGFLYDRELLGSNKVEFIYTTRLRSVPGGMFELSHSSLIVFLAAADAF